MTEPEKCPTCHRPTCDVQVAGGGVVKADWPPFVPVIEMPQVLVAYSPTIPTVGADFKSLPYYYEGFRLGSPAGSMLVREHHCNERTDLVRVLTDHGAKQMQEYDRG